MHDDDNDDDALTEILNVETLGIVALRARTLSAPHARIILFKSRRRAENYAEECAQCMCEHCVPSYKVFA